MNFLVSAWLMNDNMKEMFQLFFPSFEFLYVFIQQIKWRFSVFFLAIVFVFFSLWIFCRLTFNCFTTYAKIIANIYNFLFMFNEDLNGLNLQICKCVWLHKLNDSCNKSVLNVRFYAITFLINPKENKIQSL